MTVSDGSFIIFTELAIDNVSCIFGYLQDSTIWHFNFGNTTLVLYALFVVVEMILHTIRSIHARQSEGLPLEHANQMNLKLVLFMDILQFPLSLIFTRFLNIFSGMNES